MILIFVTQITKEIGNKYFLLVCESHVSPLPWRLFIYFHFFPFGIFHLLGTSYWFFISLEWLSVNHTHCKDFRLVGGILLNNISSLHLVSIYSRVNASPILRHFPLIWCIKCIFLYLLEKSFIVFPVKIV